MIVSRRQMIRGWLGVRSPLFPKQRKTFSRFTFPFCPLTKEDLRITIRSYPSKNSNKKGYNYNHLCNLRTSIKSHSCLWLMKSQGRSRIWLMKSRLFSFFELPRTSSWCTLMSRVHWHFDSKIKKFDSNLCWMPSLIWFKGKEWKQERRSEVKAKKRGKKEINELKVARAKREVR